MISQTVPNLETQYFIDFDHTISKQDIWDSIIKKSAPEERTKILARYLAGEISSHEYNSSVAKCLKITVDEAHELAHSIGIDPTFHDFVNWSKKQLPSMSVKI